MANEKNLITPEALNARKTPEERSEAARRAGIASGEAKRAKKNMKKLAKQLMESHVTSKTLSQSLSSLGIEESDKTYGAAVVAKLMQKALIDGDNSSVRLLAELTGQIGVGAAGQEDEPDFTVEYMPICIPDNGRDKREAATIGPQAGPQTMFMASKADIVIYGGAAGGGKTYALLLEGLRHRSVKGFGGVIFRHSYTQITAQGGLWDASHKIYDLVPDAVPGMTPKLHWTFSSGARLNFAHITNDDDLKGWQGTEICYLGFDELTHFSRKQFLYMLSRNRSTCGIRPYVRATCNPDADSWVADFISWWIDQNTGYPIPERSGQVRYMCVLNDTIYFAGSVEELEKEHGVTTEQCKSVTFIASRLQDNKVLMESDPGYIANLNALLEVERERLLNGNWKIKAAAGLYFKRSQVTLLDELPKDVIAWARGWDLAATAEDENGEPAYTASVLLGKRRNGRYIVANVTNQRLSADDVRTHIKQTAQMDKKTHKRVVERLPKDPGQAGKAQAQSFVKMLAGFPVKTIAESGSKEVRAEPFAAQWQHGNVDVLLADWNEMYFSELESFPESKFKDMVDAGSSAFAELESSAVAAAPPTSGGLQKASYWKNK